jgi:hypothetical protein
VDIPRMRMFNDCIADLALREITWIGARYTWLACGPSLECSRSCLCVGRVGGCFPALHIKGSYQDWFRPYAPPTFIWRGSLPRLNHFHFENFWLSQSGFVEAVQSK